MFGATPFITTIAARIFLGEKLHGHTMIAMAVAVAGLALSVAGSLPEGALAGMAVAFLVVLCMSGNYVVVRHRRDVGMAPVNTAHYIENRGEGMLRFLALFRSDHYADVSLNQWLALTPPELVREHLHLSEQTMAALSKQKQFVVK